VHFHWRLSLALVFCLSIPLRAQSHVEYAGGTVRTIAAGVGGSLDLGDDQYFAFYSKKTNLRIPYSRINLVEYGQQVDRRIALAVVISPLFLMTKSRKHFLTVGYTGEDGKQQAMVFQVDKSNIRTTLVSLEARTGLRVEYQDEEARKAGK
jgi:hypothetical protein